MRGSGHDPSPVSYRLPRSRAFSRIIEYPGRSSARRSARNGLPGRHGPRYAGGRGGVVHGVHAFEAARPLVLQGFLVEDTGISIRNDRSIGIPDSCDSPSMVMHGREKGPHLKLRGMTSAGKDREEPGPHFSPTPWR